MKTYPVRLNQLLLGNLKVWIIVFVLNGLLVPFGRAQAIRFTINGQNASAASAVSVCINTPVVFENTSTGYTNPRWFFKSGNPATATGNTAISRFSNIGTDSVTLLLSRSNLPDTSLKVPILVVNNDVNAAFSSNPTGQCAGTPVFFTNQSTGSTVLSYNWSFGDPNSGTANTTTLPNPNHRFVGTPGNGSATFNVKLVAANAAGCKDSITQTVNVKQVPGTQMGGSNATTYEGKTFFRICTSNLSGDVIVINQSSTAATNTNYVIKWGNSDPDFSGPAFNNLTRTFLVGIYDLNFIVTGGNGCIDTASYGVFVGSNPAVGLGNPGNTSICTGSTLTFPVSNTASNPPGTFYTVTFNDRSNSIQYQHPAPSSVTHQFDVTSCGTTSGSFPNSFQATITATNPCLSSQATVVPIYVSEKAKAIIGISPLDTACIGRNVSINDNSGNISFINGSSCSDGKRIWTISPATGFSLIGTLGNDNGFAQDPTLWTTGSAGLNLNFNQPGTYIIKLRVGNPVCGRDSVVRTICVNPAPVANFTTNASAGCAPLVVNITNNSNVPTCGANTYQWAVSYLPHSGCLPATSDYTLLNGTTLTSAAPIFRFNNPGTYTLSLITRNSGGVCTSLPITQQIVVREKPNANFSMPAAICQGNGLNFSANFNNCGANTGTNFSWVFPNANPSTANIANPTNIRFNTDGISVVELFASNECGVTVVSKPLTVNPTPVVTVPENDSVCRGSSAGPFVFSTTPPATVNWVNSNPLLGLAASGVGNINSFIANNAGNGTISVTPVLGNCTGLVKSFILTVSPLPLAPNPPGITTYCVGDAATPLAATPIANHVIRWYTTATGGSPLATVPTPETTTPGTTSWWASQVNSITGCEGPRTQFTVTVFPIPVLTDAVGINPTTCAAVNGSILLSGLLPNTVYNVTYTRSGTPVSLSLTANNAGNITIPSLAAGVYDQIRVSVGGGCLSVPKGPVSLSDPNPPATPTAASNSPICSGATLTLTASSPTPGALVYSWSGPNGFNSNVQNPTLNNATIAASGMYSVTARLGNCTSPAGSVQVVVNPTPVVTVNSNSPVCSGTGINLSANSPNGTSVTFNWTGPDNFTSTEQNPTIANATAINGGIYRVIATLGLCPSAQQSLQVVVNPTPVIANVIPFNPTNCGTASGNIQVTGLTPNTTYQVFFNRNGIPQSGSQTTNGVGSLTIPNLIAATYANISVMALGCSSAPVGPVVLSDPNPPAPPVASSNSPLCIGSTIRLTATATGNGTYQWTGPNNFISNQQNPIIANAGLAQSGLYSVRFTVNGCVSDPSNLNVLVSQNASLANAGPNQQLCNQSSTLLQALAPTNGSGLWSLLAGSPVSISNTDNPNATVSNLPLGLTRLVWTVTNNVCPPGTDTLDIVNLPPVTQSVSLQTPEICFGQSVSLSGANPVGGTGSFTYQWQQSANNIIFTNILGATNSGYLASPTSNTWYRRQVNSGACLHNSDTLLVTVRPPLANNQLTAPAEVCINTAPANITGSTPTGGEGGYTYTWEYSTNGGTNWFTVANANGKDLAPGVLTQTTSYRRMVSTALCSGAQMLTSNVITIVVRPNAELRWQPAPLTGCTPLVINSERLNLTHNAQINSTYNWFANGLSLGSGLTFPGFTIAAPGDSAIIKAVAVSLFGCLNDSAVVTFKTTGNPEASFVLSDSVGCGPLRVTFTNTTPGLSGFNFLWNFGNGHQSNMANPGIKTFARNPDFGDTLYTVTLRASNGCDTFSVARQIRVRAPAKSIINPNKVEGCSPARFVFTNNSRGSGATFVWNFGDGSPLNATDARLVTHTFNTGIRRIYQVSLLSRNDCGSDTARVNLVVSPNPIQVNLLADVNSLNGCTPHRVTFINNSIGATTFRYNFGDGTPEVISNRQFDTINHTYPQPGNYMFTLTAISACTDTTVERQIAVASKPLASFTRTPGIVCIGQPVSFTNNSSPGASIQWNFGDGTGSGLANPKKKYTTPGTYRVTLYASTNVGAGFNCTDSANLNVIVRDTLPGSFTVFNAGNCAPFAISFKTNLANPAATFWDFGDGTTTQGDSVSHSFLSAGTYTVTMMSREAGGCIYKTIKSVVVSGPSGQLVYPAPFVCLGNTIILRAISSNTSRFIYYFGNGDSAVSLNNSISYRYPAPGTFLPKVVLQSGNCRSEIQGRDSIKVDKVTASFSHTALPGCGFTTIRFSETGSTFFGKAGWQWQFGNGRNSSFQNPDNTYFTEGAYPVKMVLTGLSGCKDSITLPIRVDIEKFPEGSLSGDSMGCIGQTLQWQGSVRNIPGDMAYRWLLGDGRQLTGNVIRTSYARGGDFTLSLIASTPFGCNDTVTKVISILVDPLISAGPDIQVCKGQNIQLRATGGIRYEWSPSTWLSCANCPNPTLQPLESISYVITGYNSFGCMAKDTLFVEVPQPFRIHYSANDTLCLGSDKQLQAGGAQRFVWSPSTALNNPNIANPIARPTITTTYRVVGYDNANCFTDTGYVTIEVGRIPTVDIGNGGAFVAGTQVQLAPRLGNGPFARYDWTPSHGLSCTNCPNPLVTVGNNITYRLQVTSPLGCSSFDTISFRALCIQAEQVYIPNAFSPDGDGINDVLMVRGKGLSRVKSFRIFNRMGQVVFERQNFDANDPAYGWNGTINGTPASADVYVFTAELLCTGGTTYFEKGNVTLFR